MIASRLVSHVWAAVRQLAPRRPRRSGGAERARGVMPVLGGLAALVVASGVALAMAVSPVFIELNSAGSGTAATLTVTNTFSNPLPVELRLQGLELGENGEQTLTEVEEDVLIFPPQALIAPGNTQNFRLQWVGEPDIERSRHYVVSVAQTPVQLPEGVSGIQLLYNFQVIVSVAPAGAPPAALSVDTVEVRTLEDGTRRAAVRIVNPSPRHGYLSQMRVRLVQADNGETVLDRFLQPSDIGQTVGRGLVPGEGARVFVLPVDLPSASADITVELSDGPR